MYDTFENVLHSFSRQKRHVKFYALARTLYKLQHPRHNCYCGVTWYLTRTAFFSS